MRQSADNAHVAIAQTTDAGAHWQDVPSQALGNPDSSVAALRVGNTIWLAHNPLLRRREVLQLSQSPVDAPDAWQTQDVLNGASGDEFSYPSMIAVPVAQQQMPDVWLSYTDQRRDIAFKQLRMRCGVAP